MSLSSLTLYTRDSSVGSIQIELIELLVSVGLIGDPIHATQFLAGPRFFKHITFLGCAPNISTLPEQGPQFIRITIPELTKHGLFFGSRAPAPLCGHCKHTFDNWVEDIKHSENNGITCPQCHTSTPISHLNFRKKACYSQNIVRIEPIFESEALPANGLLDTLNKRFNAHFAYAYIT